MRLPAGHCPDPLGAYNASPHPPPGAFGREKLGTEGIKGEEWRKVKEGGEGLRPLNVKIVPTPLQPGLNLLHV